MMPSTFKASRNAEKRAARMWGRVARAQAVERAGGRKTPKRHHSVKSVDMLADRALRQRKGEHALVAPRAKKHPSKYQPHQGAQEMARRAARGR